ncbi:MAG: hypothetical protein JJU00_12835 [Opitutales bacterium]|nr:hypothetical protein [Opitutales bacterium]
MKTPSLFIFSALALSPLHGESLDLPATFDTTIDFWNGVVNSDQSANKQMWAGNSGSAPNASEEIYRRFFERFGPVVKFDLSEVTPEMVNDPGFSATLDVMAHGFAADRNVFIGNGATTPPEFAHHEGDGITNLVVHALLTEGANSLNRWLANSTSGSLLNWDGSVPTNFALATADAGNFRAGNYEAAPRAMTTFVHGWNQDPPPEGATRPNLYGELTWDITSLVRDWVNGDLPNYGLLIATDPETSYGEQINMLTMETDDRPDSGISQPGDATPMLRLRIDELIEVVAPERVTALRQDDGLSLSFPSVSGLTYRLQQSATLAPDSWNNTGASVSGTGALIEMMATLPGNGERLFYRIAVDAD